MQAHAIPKPDSREEWLAMRRNYIGGSDVAAILGLSPWKTPVALYLEKTGRAPDEEPRNSEALRLGSYLEDYAAGRYSEETGRTVRNYGYMLADEESRMAGDVDRLIVPDGAKIAALRDEIRTDALLECKTSGAGWDDGVPAHYEAQVQQYMALTGCERADFAVVFLAPRREFRMWSVARDDGVIAAMRERTAEWWRRYVEADTPPPAECEADCKLLWAASRPVTAAANLEIASTLARLREIEAAIKGLEAEAGDARSAVMAYMGDADTLVGPDGRKLCTWKSAKASDRTDWKAVADVLARTETPEYVARVVAEHTESKPGSRRFLLSKVA